MKKNRSKLQNQIVVLTTIAFFVMTIAVIVPRYNAAYAHLIVNKEATVKNIDKYRIAFQLYPKFASAGKNATLHFSIFDRNNSNVNGVFAAMVMKEKGKIIEQTPYKLYEFGDISIPYKFQDNVDHTATLLTRISGDSKYQSNPLVADFDIPVRQTTVVSANGFALQVALFSMALAGGLVFLFKKKWKG